MTTQQPPALLSSYFFWLHYFEQKPEVYTRLRKKGRMLKDWTYPSSLYDFRRSFTHCPFCAGSGVKNFPEPVNVHKELAVTSVYCVCNVLELVERINHGETPMRGGFTFDKFQYNYEAVDPKERSMKNTIELLKKWTRSPFTWLYFTGGMGSGKTSAMESIKAELGNLVYYINVADLQTRVHTALNKKQGETVQDIQDDLVQCSILALDDFGAEYQKGDFTYSILYAAVNRRYIRGRAAPMIVSSNVSADDFLSTSNSYLARIADRLFDQNIARTLFFNQKSARTGL